MIQHNEIESFRYIKAARRLLRPATEKLEAFVREDFSDELKLEALLNLGRIGDNESLAVLLKALEEFPDSVEPITALGYFKSGTPVARLIERLRDPDALYKEEIVRVLGEIGDPMATRPLIELLHDEDRMVRYYSARALFKMGGRDVVQSLCGLLNDPDEWIVINVLEILSKLRDPEAVPALVGQFEIARDSRLKAIIISSLATFNEGRLLKTFEAGLESFDPRIQANSVEAISQLKIPALEMKRKLKKLYGHPNNRVRANVCIAMAKADPQAVYEEVLAMLESKDASTRRSAAYVLARIEIDKRQEFVHQLLRDENFGVRKMALKAALSLSGSVGVGEIRPLFEDTNQWVRKEAVECAMSIENFPDSDVLALLKKEESAPVIECLLKYVIDRNLTAAVTMIFDRIRKEPEEEMPWLIAALGHLGAREELLKVKKFLGPVRAEVLSEYYQALLLNGELSVFEELSGALAEKKREAELMTWGRVAGDTGAFIQNTGRFSAALFKSLSQEVEKDMHGIAVLEGSDSSEPTFFDGLEAFNGKDYARARVIFSHVYENQSDNLDAAYYLANSLYNLGEIAASVALLKKIVVIKPDHIEAGVLLGQIHFRKKEWVELSECYTRLAKYLSADDKKNQIRIYGALGLALYHQKKFQPAVEALNVGLRANPRDLSSSYHLALCYYSLGDTDKAKSILESLRKTLPPDSQVLKNVIELLQRI